ncbi:hypothetical protein [Streptomyces sp. NRRL F-2580]|nr:hypothetical protein [Streptomyces sp. NRRL F-2580]
MKRPGLTADTATPAGPVRSWPAAGRTPAGSGAHSDEIREAGPHRKVPG